MVQVKVLPDAGLFRCESKVGGQASTSASKCASLTGSSRSLSRKRTQPPMSRDLLLLNGIPPIAQRRDTWRMNSGVTPLMYGSSVLDCSSGFISTAGKAGTSIIESRPLPKLPCIRVTTWPFCRARPSSELTALPSRSSSTSKLIGTSGSAGPTKVMARERTGRPGEVLASMASYSKAAISPPKQARPWAQLESMVTAWGCWRTAVSNCEKFMPTSAI
ncbi:hypothetical protein D3C79_654800 [compost metagenome]